MTKFKAPIIALLFLVKRTKSKRPRAKSEGLLTLRPLLFALCSLPLLGCSSNENAHTTATTFVQPPPRQVLTVVPAPSTPEPERSASPTRGGSSLATDEYIGVDLQKPLLLFNLPNGKSFCSGDIVGIDFSVRNAKLRAEGGEFRVRYIVDDEDAKWVDNPQPFGLSGWVPGKHTIRLELIGPDGWPYRNGNHNIVTREISVEAN